MWMSGFEVWIDPTIKQLQQATNNIHMWGRADEKIKVRISQNVWSCVMTAVRKCRKKAECLSFKW